jgi:hypothetical protein
MLPDYRFSAAPPLATIVCAMVPTMIAVYAPLGFVANEAGKEAIWGSLRIGAKNHVKAKKAKRGSLRESAGNYAKEMSVERMRACIQ